MAIANHVSPQAAEFVEFVEMMVREDWRIDGKPIAPGARQFFAEVSTMIEIIERHHPQIRLKTTSTTLGNISIGRREAPP
jgi:hypothetical protein